MIKVTKHGTTTYERTKYGSYVNINECGMVQQKNAMSYKELVKYGYEPVNRINERGVAQSA